MHKLEELKPGPKITSIDKAKVIMFDGHAVIQMIANYVKQLRETKFKDTALNFMTYILKKINKICKRNSYCI